MGTAPIESSEVPAGYEDVPHQRLRLKPRRRAIARNLLLAAAVPTLTADMQVDLTSLLAARHEWNGAPGRTPEDRISIMAFVARATVSVLLEYPAFNATYGDRAMLLWEVVNLGVAVDSPGGVVVPVIRDVHLLGLRELARRIGDTVARSRSGDLTVEDLTGGTFTVSNPGSVGPSVRAEALLSVPQVALLGLPGIKRVPLVVGSGDDERVEIRTAVSPSLTFDHRALDGADAVRFLAALTQRLEGWPLEAYLRPESETRTPPT